MHMARLRPYTTYPSDRPCCWLFYIAEGRRPVQQNPTRCAGLILFTLQLRAYFTTVLEALVYTLIFFSSNDQHNHFLIY